MEKYFIIETCRGRNGTYKRIVKNTSGTPHAFDDRRNAENEIANRMNDVQSNNIMNCEVIAINANDYPAIMQAAREYCDAVSHQPR